jgi:hypothetical protein
MNWLRPRRPSPALVVSIIALIVALGGTGYAAITLPKNSVGTKQLKKKAVTNRKIRNKAVTNSKIRNNAVTGSKVKNDSLTGRDIRESTLGKVPNAHHADIADSATNASNANTLQGHGAGDFVFASREATFYKKLQIGQEATLFTFGPLTFTARCSSPSAGNQELQLLVATTQNGVVMDTGDDDFDNNPPGDTLNTDTPEENREVIDDTHNGSTSAYFNDIDNGVLAAPDGTTIAFSNENVGIGFNQFGADCIVHGIAFQTS